MKTWVPFVTLKSRVRPLTDENVLTVCRQICCKKGSLGEVAMIALRHVSNCGVAIDAN